jgi:nucleoside triphosphate pyrophosphatase
VVTSRVTMKPYDAAEIERYVVSGEPLDKAGAYAIQGLGGALIEGVVGSYSNVVGLPIEATRALLQAFDVPVTPEASSGPRA